MLYAKPLLKPKKTLLLPSVLKEISGLEQCSSMPNFFWAINDSGNMSAIFRVNRETKSIHTSFIPKQPNHDWEDLSCGPCLIPVKRSEECLYVADIGNNHHVPRNPKILMVPIGHIKSNKIALPKIIMQLKYPVEPFDAEALVLVGPPLQFLLFTKNKKKKLTNVYLLKIPEKKSEFIDVEMELIGEVSLKNKKKGKIWISSADSYWGNPNEIWLLSFKYLIKLEVEQLTKGKPKISDPKFMTLPKRANWESLSLDESGSTKRNTIWIANERKKELNAIQELIIDKSK